jgi:hypothetical protein
MNLTIDANILVSEVDGETGMAQSLLLHPTFEAVYIAEYTWNEAMYVLDRKFAGWVRGGRLTQDIADAILRGTIAVFVSLYTVIPETIYTGFG